MKLQVPLKISLLGLTLFLLIFFQSPATFAQDNEVDSLKKCLLLTKEDTNKASLYNRLTLLTDSLHYAEMGLEIAKKNKNTQRIVNSLATIGVYYHFHEKQDIALYYLNKAMRLAEQNDYKESSAYIYKFIGFIYRPKEPLTALEYYKKSLKIYTESKDERAASYILSAIGNVYEGINNNKQKSLEYYLKSLEIRERQGRPEEIASSLNETSRIYEQMDNNDMALELRERGFQIAERAVDTLNMINLSNLIGHLFYKLHNYDKALYYERKAYQLITAKGNVNYTVLSEIAHSLASTYSKLDNYQESAKYYALFVECNDSMKIRDNNANLIRLKQALSEEKEKQQLFIKDKEIEQQKILVEKQTILRNAFIIGFSLVVILILFIYRSYKQKKIANKLLEEKTILIEKQKRVVDEKNIQITESINYAQRIQEAILPSVDLFKLLLPKSFIFFQPKDIVSGDFYFIKKFKNHTLLACVDCTGHGVPGGFMSTVGNLLLDKITDNEASLPSDILRTLNDEIIRVLHQNNGGEIQDGMDISICLIDHNNSQIKFSGARNGIIIVSGEKATRYKAESLPVGGNYFKKGIPIQRDFKTQSIKIDKNDWVYMYTDGFIEQIGGQDEIPMNYSQFEESLIELSKKEAAQKEFFLQEKLITWKKKHERDDDILIIGFQIT